MRTHGTLAKWNDDRGFGFIAPALFGPDPRWGYYKVGLRLVCIARCICRAMFAVIS